MMSEDKDRALQKLLQKAKITFILGGPASGKGTQCEKLVEEFGYTHISTGDLMRAEIAKGTKEGDRIKKIVADGGLVPFETTVHVLKQGMLATPSKNYLIDGFPRAVDQAQYFEQNVVEAQQVLFYDVPQELMIERCMKRAETSGRSDDNEETIKKRIQQFFDQSVPVVDYYSRFGKVRKIDATGSISEVYAQSKDAVLPQTELILGTKGSGKTTIAKNLCERTNAAYLNFHDFCKRDDVQDIDEEELVVKLIQTLAEEPKPRVVLENFPQNHFQAKFFMRNCKAPNNVFLLKCSQDICQSRMTELGEGHPSYVSSMELGVQLKEFHANAKALIPYLQESTRFAQVDTNQAFEQTMALVNKLVEPAVIHIRPGATAATNDLRKEITEKLKEHGYMNLDVAQLERDEIERRTAIGCEMNLAKQSNKKITPEMQVRMLKKIVYSGNPQCNKFILSSFPDIIEEAKEFEANCARIQALLYPSGPDKTVELKGNNLSLFNIDSLFQKEFRLRTMDCWDYDLFNEKMGNVIEYGVVVGRSLTGKSEICGQLAAQGYQVIDMKAITEAVKVRLTPEDGEFEGEVPIADVEKDVAKILCASRGAATKCKFVFDGYTQADAEKFLEFTSQFGLPQFVLQLTCLEEKTLKQRWSKKNEDGDFPEEGDVVDDWNAARTADEAARAKLTECYQAKAGRVELVCLDTGKSLETTKRDLRSAFAPKVIIVNHEKRFGVDVVCSNVAIKYNMLYISVYQLIREHIKTKTSWGKKLCDARREKEMNLQINATLGDEFEEEQYSAVHFSQKLICELINDTIAQNKTNQKYIILEGVCNSMKLCNEADRLELRLQDELNNIDSNIGQIQSILGLQFAEEPELIDKKNVEYEKFAEPAAKEEKPKPAEGEEEAVEAPPEEEDGTKKKEKFKPELYKWTVSNNKSKNLPQCFISSKSQAKVNFDKKQSSSFSTSPYEAITLALDEFVQLSINKSETENADKGKPFCYRQIIFEQ